jgi:hypothetical protein
MLYGTQKALQTLGFRNTIRPLKPRQWRYVQYGTVGLLGLTVLSLSGYGLEKVTVSSEKAALWKEMHEVGTGLLVEEFK